jgi:hypothetical protein
MWIPDIEAVVASAPLRFVESKARSAEKQARDDVGRWRKIYYHLRRNNVSAAKVTAAYKLVKDAERRQDLGILKQKGRNEEVRRGLAKRGLSELVDERVSAPLVREAAEAARVARRLEALGPDTMVNIGSLPQDMQDLLKEYLSQTNLEPRIQKHFGPFTQGKVQRSVKDILNLMERTTVDSQQYVKGYDREH